MKTRISHKEKEEKSKPFIVIQERRKQKTFQRKRNKLCGEETHKKETQNQIHWNFVRSKWREEIFQWNGCGKL